MSLFQRSRTQADRLARRRARHATGEDLDPPLLELLDELGLAHEKLERGWVVTLGPVQVLLMGVRKEGVVGGYAPLGPMTAVEGMRRLIHVNLEHSLGYFAAGDPGEVSGRIQVPADPFDREGVVQGLEALAELLDAVRRDDFGEIRERLHAARRGEPDAQVARRQATRDLEAALGELELPGSPREDGIWALDCERGLVDAVLADTGASWMLMHQLSFSSSDRDPNILRWLLDSSGRRGARLGLADLPDGPALFSVIVLPASALNTSKVAYGVEQVLRVGDEVDGLREYL